ncbi:ZZ-type zinc finger-containing protein 3 [Thoreauomyces humboldtii]|nr:ZZ-type zinc finger-containing protein 3 [Thoreauomyces humboldtii]
MSDALTVLRQQLVQAQADIERLSQLRQEALDDPATFVEKMKSRRYDEVPKLQRIARLPSIDLRKYMTEPESHVHRSTRTRTRSHMSDFFERNQSPVPGSWAAISTPPRVSSPIPYGDSPTPASNAPPNTASSEEKSQTFNQGWSQEEHARLLELMELYPHEPVAARRMEKISAALGSRTPRQVATRVQKFLDRRKTTRSPMTANRPMNFVQPSLTTGSTRPNNHKRVSGMQYSNRFTGSRYLGSATLTLSDDEEDDGVGMNVDPALRQTDEYKELVRLQAVARLNASNQPAAHAADPIHYGFTCDRCGAEPIVGVRWTCRDCPAGDEVDLCDECFAKGYRSDVHNDTHSMRKVTEPEIVDGADSAPADPYAYLGL